MARYYFIVGEDSGDLHASLLIRALKKMDSEAVFRGWGGSKMKAEGYSMTTSIEETNFMGFWEVVKHLKTIRGLFRNTKKDILSWKPDVVILIDYPGFNLRMAKWLKKKNMKVVYYIVPQVWAWKKNRSLILHRNCDLILTILPFESSFFKKQGVAVSFVGHPLVESIVAHTPTSYKKNKPIIALLPGSRSQEVKKILPVMASAASQLSDFDIYVSQAPSLPIGMYKELLIPYPHLKIWSGELYDLLSLANKAVVTSGTATLETALFNVPQVVVYKAHFMSYEIGKKLVHLSFISLVNIILQKEIVPELIQGDFTQENVIRKLSEIDQNRERIQKDYESLALQLKGENASYNAAIQIRNLLKNENAISSF